MKRFSTMIIAASAGFLALSTPVRAATVVKAQTNSGTLFYDSSSGRLLGNIKGLGCIVISAGEFVGPFGDPIQADGAATCSQALANPQMTYEFSPINTSNRTTIQGFYQGPCASGMFVMLNITPQNSSTPQWYLKLNGIASNFCQ